MRIVIVGLGLIGGSYAKGLIKQDYNVMGIDNNNDVIEYALKEGIILDGGTDPSIFLPTADIVILSIYPDDILSFLEKYKSYFKKGCIITDVTGIKTSFIYKVNDLLPNDVEFIGAHPMAGKEKVGIVHSDPEIFQGANFIITITEKNTEEGINKVKEIAKNLKFGYVSVISPEKHDEMIAFTSQLTHAIAVSLINSDNHDDTPDFTGDSFRDLTRIAMINEKLWTELFLCNKEYLIGKIDNFSRELESLRSLIVSENKERLEELFKKSTKRRKKF